MRISWFAKQNAIIANVIRIIVKFTTTYDIKKTNIYILYIKCIYEKCIKFIQKSLECALFDVGQLPKPTSN